MSKNQPARRRLEIYSQRLKPECRLAAADFYYFAALHHHT